ncbi:MAG TPA: hypothetical protein VHC97_25420 [Thermoanaerobaculia bacterium]|nr:hypothetical protein [Thermoanaerobaculia bacterium]
MERFSTTTMPQEMDSLFELLYGAEPDNTAAAAELLAKIRELRERVRELPDSRLRALCGRLLDEVWEAACASVFGDVWSLRERTVEALVLGQDLRRSTARP